MALAIRGRHRVTELERPPLPDVAIALDLAAWHRAAVTIVAAFVQIPTVDKDDQGEDHGAIPVIR